jgi:hypothetical protein
MKSQPEAYSGFKILNFTPCKKILKNKGVIIFHPGRLNIMNPIDGSTSLKSALTMAIFFKPKPYLTEI